MSEARELRPRDVAQGERLEAIRGAIARRVVKGEDVPREWLEEYYEVVEWLSTWYEKDEEAHKKRTKVTLEQLRKAWRTPVGKQPEAAVKDAEPKMCGNCRWWLKVDNESINVVYGRCMRYPPPPSDPKDFTGKDERVNVSDSWYACGEWKEKV